MFEESIKIIVICYLLFNYIKGSGLTGHFTHDQTSPRTNTLFDDADDIQRQLDNEARDRIKYGKPKTVWVFHFPTHYPDQNLFLMGHEQNLMEQPRESQKRIKRSYAAEESKVTPPLPPNKEWNYSSQNIWFKTYPDCGGRSQSPVDLPAEGLTKARGARAMLFKNYDEVPSSITLMSEGQRISLRGEWKPTKRPLIYGGAAHSRRYLFDSLIFHWPSEHTVALFKYPLESQAFFVSAEYKDMEQALEASPGDPQAFLAISNLYKYGNHTHKGIQEILDAFKSKTTQKITLPPKPFKHYNPPFKEYACYQGSMPIPPCTESVLWLIRGRALSIKRETVDAYELLMTPNNKPSNLLFRNPQPLNDRKVFLFK